MDVKLTKKGELDGRFAKTVNKNIVKVIEAAKVDYEKSFDAVADKSAGLLLSDEARESVRENVIEKMENYVQELSDGIKENDLDGNVNREIRSIIKVDDNVDYDNLEDSNQKEQYDGKIKGLKANIESYDKLEKEAKNPKDKLIYSTAKDLCDARKTIMELRAGLRPESEEVISMTEEEVRTNDLIRFERFKKWAKENLVGVSAVAISVAGIITTAVVAGRNAVKKGAKAVGQFGKALANLARKAGPAIATILNILAQVLTWGAKALEFLSRNLWIVALFLTYLVYDTMKNKKLN